MSKPDHDPVSNPAHYTRLDPEPLDVIEAWNLDFHRGQVVKYVARAGHKESELEDLRKARFYLDRLIARLAVQEESSEPPTGPMADYLRAMYPLSKIEAMATRHRDVMVKYPPQPEPRPAIDVEPGNNPECTDKGGYGDIQPGDCSTVSDDEECPWQSQACDSCREYYGIGKDGKS